MQYKLGEQDFQRSPRTPNPCGKNPSQSRYISDCIIQENAFIENSKNENLTTTGTSKKVSF